MTYEQGAVWWGPAPHKSSAAYRPWVIVNTDAHPFAHTESIVLAMTTTEHSGAVRVPDGAWKKGGSNKESFVSPWYPTTIKHHDFDRHQGTLDSELVETAVSELHQYTTVNPK
jgi:mRNA-degrading endonuclease toxin of MazEF toxin-antitoxin module